MSSSESEPNAYIDNCHPIEEDGSYSMPEEYGYDESFPNDDQSHSSGLDEKTPVGNTLPTIDVESSVYIHFSFAQKAEEVFLCLQRYNYETLTPMERVGDTYYQVVLLPKGSTENYYFFADNVKIVDSAKPVSSESDFNILEIDADGNQTVYTEVSPLKYSHETYNETLDDSEFDPSIVSVANYSKIKTALTKESIQVATEDESSVESGNSACSFSFGDFESGKSETFVVDLPFLLPVDSLDFNLEFSNLVTSLGQLKHEYSISAEYYTDNGEWASMIEKSPLSKFLTVGPYIGSIPISVRTHKVRITVYSDNIETTDTSASSKFFRTFNYAGKDFDKNGVLYYFGTRCGTTKYANPATLRYVNLEISNSYAFDGIISHNGGLDADCISGEPVYFTVDLGDKFVLNCSAYSLRHGLSYADMMIADWTFEGSNDNENWVRLHDQYLTPFDDSNLTKTFFTNKNPGYFRYFRVLMKGAHGYRPLSGPSGSNSLYIGGFELFGELIAVSTKPVESLKTISVSLKTLHYAKSTQRVKTYKYTQDMDKKGILYSIGSKGGTGSYQNPAKDGKIKLTVSSLPWNVNDKYHVINLGPPCYSLLGPDKSPPTWFYIDLGENSKSKVTHYTLRHGSSFNENFIQNWELQGSNDAENWETLHAGKESPWTYAYQTTTWNIEECKEFYRYFKVVQFGQSISSPSQPGRNGLCVCGFELYGDVLLEDFKETSEYSEQTSRRLLNSLVSKSNYIDEALANIEKGVDIEVSVKFLNMLVEVSKKNAEDIPPIRAASLVSNLFKEVLKTSSLEFCKHASCLISQFTGYPAIRDDVFETLIELIPLIPSSIQIPEALDVFSTYLDVFTVNTQRLRNVMLKTIVEKGMAMQPTFSKNYTKLFNNYNVNTLVLDKYLFRMPDIKKGISDESSSDALEKLTDQLDESANQFESSKIQLITLLDSDPKKKEIENAIKVLTDFQGKIYLCQMALIERGATHPSLRERLDFFSLDRSLVICERYFTHLYLKPQTDDNDMFDQIFESFCLYAPGRLKMRAAEYLVKHLRCNPMFPVSCFNKYLCGGFSVSIERVVMNILMYFFGSKDHGYNSDYLNHFFQILQQRSLEDASIITNCLTLLDNMSEKEYSTPHNNTTCTACGISPISGVRWRCLNCVNCDICNSCEAKGVHDEKHLLVKIAKPLPLQPVDTEATTLDEPLIPKVLYPDDYDMKMEPMHAQMCDSCGNNIYGARFKCTQCVDYNLCAKCIPTMEHFAGHLFAKVNVPLPIENDSDTPLVNIVLHRGFYPLVEKKEPEGKISLFASSRTIKTRSDNKADAVDSPIFSNDNIKVLFDILYNSASSTKYLNILYLSFKVLKNLASRISPSNFKSAFVDNPRLKKFIELLISSPSALNRLAVSYLRAIFNTFSAEKFRDTTNESPVELRDRFRDTVIDIYLASTHNYGNDVMPFITLVSKASDISMRTTKEKKLDWKTASAPIKHISQLFYPTEKIRKRLMTSLRSIKPSGDLALWLNSLELLVLTDPHLMVSSGDFKFLLEAILTSDLKVRNELSSKLHTLVTTLKNVEDIREKVLSTFVNMFFQKAEFMMRSDLIAHHVASFLETDVGSTIINPTDLAYFLSHLISVLPKPSSITTQEGVNANFVESNLLGAAIQIIQTTRFKEHMNTFLGDGYMSKAIGHINDWLTKFTETSINNNVMVTKINNQLISLLELVLLPEDLKSPLFSVFMENIDKLLSISQVFKLVIKLLEKEQLSEQYVIDMEGHEKFLDTIQSYLKGKSGDSETTGSTSTDDITSSLPVYDGLTSFSPISMGLDLPSYSNFNQILTTEKPHEQRNMYQMHYTGYGATPESNSVSILIETKCAYLLKGFWISFSSYTPTTNPHVASIIIESGLEKDDLNLICIKTFDENKSQTEGVTKIIFDDTYLSKYVRLTFNRWPTAEYLTFYSLQILGHPNIFAESSKSGTTDITANYMSKLVRIISTAFASEKVREFYKTNPKTSDFMMALFKLNSDERDLVEGILQHIVSSSPELRKKLFSLLVATDFPPSSAQFVGRICSMSDDQRDERLGHLKERILEIVSNKEFSTESSGCICALSYSLYDIDVRKEKYSISFTPSEIKALLHILSTPYGDGIKVYIVKILISLIHKDINNFYIIIDTLELKESAVSVADFWRAEVALYCSSVSDSVAKIAHQMPFFKQIFVDLENIATLHDDYVGKLLPTLTTITILRENRVLFSQYIENIYNYIVNSEIPRSLRTEALEFLTSLINLSEETEVLASLIKKTMETSGEDSDLVTVIGNLLYKEDSINLCLHALEYGAKELLMLDKFSTISEQVSLAVDEELSCPDVPIVAKDTIDASTCENTHRWKTFFFNPPVPNRGITSYDFEIVHTENGSISLGITDNSAPNDSPLGTSPNSIGYYGYYSSYVSEDNSTLNYGQSMKSGQVITMVIDMINGTLEFLMNGESMGIASSHVDSSVVYHPAISMVDSDIIRITNYRASTSSGLSKPNYFSSTVFSYVPVNSTLKTINDVLLISTKMEKEYTMQFYTAGNETLYSQNDIPVASLIPTNGLNLVDLFFKIVPVDPKESVAVDDVKKQFTVFNQLVKQDGLPSLMDFLFTLLNHRKIKTTKEEVPIQEWKFWIQSVKRALKIEEIQGSITETRDIATTVNTLIATIRTPHDLRSKREPVELCAKPKPIHSFLNLLSETASMISTDRSKELLLVKGLVDNEIFLSLLTLLSDITDIHPKIAEDDTENEFSEYIKEVESEKEKKKKKENSASQQYWAKGTGFGTSNDATSEFNLTAYIRKNLELAEKAGLVFTLFLLFFSITKEENEALADKIKSLVDKSAFKNILISYLRNDSLFEMARSMSLYKSIFGLVRTLAEIPSYQDFFSSEDQSASVFSLLEQLQRIAVLVDKLPSLNKEAKDKDDNKDEHQEDVKEAEPEVAEGSEKELAHDIKVTFEFLKGKISPIKAETSGVATDSCEESNFVNLYREALSAFQFGEADMKDKSGTYEHHYKTKISKEEASKPEKMKRIIQELSVLSTSLPCHPSSSVFLRVDEERIDVMRVLITGPEGTPYESGCFVFDVYLSNNYPDSPPSFNLMTTGKGSVRFNPNLYNCGKVCLSLLGTWRGGPNEGWNKDTSTILQVIISIQSLIFVEEPYFNEPGYESTMNTEYGDKQSEEYNHVIKIATLKWAILDMIKNTPAEFEDVIKSHFKLRKDKIKTQMKKWIEESRTGTESQQSEVKKLAENINSLLKEL